MLFLGLLFERGEEHTIAAKSRHGFLQNQVNTFQWNCIDGLFENGIENLTIVNALPVGTYPKMYSDAVIPSQKWIYNGQTHFQLGSFNIPVFKQWGRYLACKKLLKKVDEKEILIYSPYQPFLKAIEKLNKEHRVTLIVPDLPEYYDYAKVSKFRKILRKLNNRSIEKCMRRVDRFVLLTEAMKDPLGVGNRPYTIVEGICTASKSECSREKIQDRKAILYTGSLNKKFGIDILLEAFKSIQNSDYELWICGSGDYQDTVRETAERDARIKYFGFVSHKKVLELQSKATVLVNPRQNVGEYTKYSFPSKTMEYMLSGVPVVAYKLDGIPKEYDEYFHYVKDNTPDELAKTLRVICEDKSGDYDAIAKQAVTFVTEQKNPKKQAEKIMKLIGTDLSACKDKRNI